MKKLKLVLLLAALMTVGVGKNYAHDIEVANADGVTIYYNFINNRTELEVTYKGSYYGNADYEGKVVIPESVTHDGNTYAVTSIGHEAFVSCSLLTELTIPNSVTYIGNYAFSHCYGLTKLTIPGSVTSIGWKAFEDCIGLTEVTIPGSVTSIGWSAFENCISLTEVTIPKSVTSIGEAIFWGCSGLGKIIVESGNPKYDSRENCNAIITTNGNELIAGCKNTKIPNSVTFIGDYAFHGCDGLTELTIPNSVTSIGDGAFEGCSGLTELTIPNSVTSIGDEAFYGCSGLIELTIPNSVTSIGDWAFDSCSGLTEMTIGNSVTSIGERAFYNCSKLTTLYSLNTTPPSAKNYNSAFDSDHYTTVNVFVPQEALAAYQNAEVWKEFKKLQGIEYSSVKGVSAAEQIQTANGQITVTGLTDGTTVTVYTLSGQQVGTATSTGGQATVSTTLTTGTTAIVKMGDNKSVKIAVK